VTNPHDTRAEVRPGDVLAGKYRVERVLGAGGMTVVVAALHTQLDERVALKLLLPQALARPDAVARFGLAARAAARLRSNHAVRVSDVGTLENGSPYVVMEYLDGRDLSTWITQEGALPAEQAIDFLLQACEAVGEAHSLGIVHGDLKPANLFCVRRFNGQQLIKVRDFGFAMPTTAGAPEQLDASKGVDARSDIWSLGAILFELLTGAKVDNDPAPLPSAVLPGAAAALRPILARCLEKDRDLRFQTVAELVSALRGACAGV